MPQAHAGASAAGASVDQHGSSGTPGTAAGGALAGVGGSEPTAGADAQPNAGAGGSSAGAANAGAGGHVEIGGAFTGGSGGAIAQAGAANGGTGGLGGSGGNSGMAGSGGAPPKPVGSKCTKDAECALGFCTDGVCCESSCRAACKQCSPAGKCNAVPVDDDACGAIACPADTACRNYAPSITTNRCASFGVCKTAAACTFSAKPPRTSCSTSGPELCDAQANCVSPSVNCGGTTCPVNTSVCCGSNPATFACVPKGNGAECLGTVGAGPITCDEHADCPIGQQCCIGDSPVGFKYACTAAAACPASTELAHSYPICKSFSINPASACPANTTCSQYSANAPTSFEVCK
jgi:hypothetical protein